MKDGNVFVFDHPVIQHKVTHLRDKNTSTKEFRELVDEISMLMVYEVTKDFPLTEIEIETPVAKTKAKVFTDKKVTLVPILRAGLGMVAGVQSILPNTRVGFMGMYRDPETHDPVQYYCKLPDDITDSTVLVLDPMFATGGSASAAFDHLKSIGCKDLRMMCMVASRYAVERFKKDHPDVTIYCAALDEELNDHAYIVPGLGDAGDRIFGTK